MEMPRTLWLRAVAVLVFYTLLAAWYTHPLLPQRSTRIAGDPGDPVLNASVLWWNATNLPLSDQWWNAPHFHPARDVTTFTEHLLAVSAVATPVYWLSGNPLTAYNVALFVTWPLSAFATYLLLLSLTKRQDASVLGGLAWGFSAYRLSELSHLQSVSAYWLPVMLLGLHQFVARRRGSWLIVFGIGWLAQSLANAYYMVFAPVLIAMWLAYFCSTRDTWRATPALVVTWILASVPLVPVAAKYVAVHAYYGLERSLSVRVGFSADSSSWAHVAGMSWLWSPVLQDGEHNLFPGLAAIVLVAVGLAAGRRSPSLSSQPGSRGWRVLVGALWIVFAACVAGTLTLLTVGPVRTTLAGINVRMTELNRPLAAALASGATLAAISTTARSALRTRSPIVFYTAATIVFAFLASGPLMIAANQVILDPAPYAWLLSLPGFDRLRVPSRIWMLGTLCLGVSAALAYVRLPIAPRWRSAAFAVAAAALVADGAISRFPMADAPALLPSIESRRAAAAVLELPLGPEWDAAATFRAGQHRRRVVNGVSGYEPPHYAPLREGLDAKDPDVLRALASFGAFDIVVDGAADPRGLWRSYAASTPGSSFTTEADGRTLYRVPAMPLAEEPVGEPLPIARVWALESGAEVVIDGRMDTSWQNGPQRPGQWMIADLGAERPVAGVTHALGDFARDFPRRLAIDVSLDGFSWVEVWDGPTVARAFLGAVRAPRAAPVVIGFPPRAARYVRLRQIGTHKNDWRVAELIVHGPPRN